MKHLYLCLSPLLGACTSSGKGGSETGIPVAASTSGPEHCGEITADEVWAADLSPHVLTCHVRITSGTVTVGPGVEVLADSFFYLSVEGEGALEALGEPDEPVLFDSREGDGPGSWPGLSFWEGGSGTLRNAIVEDGGYVAYGSPYVGLKIHESEVLVENLVVRRSKDFGFSLTSGGRFAEGSYGLVSTESVSPGFGDPETVGTVVMPDLDLTGNDYDTMVVAWGTIAGEATWEDPGVPYSIDYDGSVSVSGEEGAPARLWIGPGVVVELDSGLGLSAGTYGPAAIIIEGTEEAPVTFTSSDPTSSFWEGLRFNDYSLDDESLLSHVDIGYGGSGYWTWGNIHLFNASPTIADVHLHDSASYGIYCQGECDPTLSGITYADNPDGDTNW